MSASPPARVLHNRYHVLRPVGRGGQGAVHEAIDLRLQNTVAVKEIAAGDGAIGPAERDDAFRREARRLTGLRHPALPLVIDYFVQDDKRFLVTQYIEGEDLAALLHRRRRFDEREVRAWTVSILQALVYLHGQHPPIVHGDITLSSIKLTPRGEIVLVNLGIDGSQDPRTDLSALGVTLDNLTGDASTRSIQRHGTAQAMLDALTGESDQLPTLARATSPSGLRRLDTAAPSRAEVGRAIDLLVQVRFSTSPRLGLEDWPSNGTPAEHVKASDDARVDHPRDRATERTLPASLRMKIVAPDFDIRGAGEHLIDVPADDYSKRLGFLLAPRRAGKCGISVEIYSAADSVYLGAVPLETDVLVEAPADALVQAGNLVLGLVAAPIEMHPRMTDTARVPVLTPEPPPSPEPPKMHPPRVVVAQAVPHAAAPVSQAPSLPADLEAFAAALGERQRRLEEADDVEHERIKAQAARRTKKSRDPVTESASSTPQPQKSLGRMWALLLIAVTAGTIFWLWTRPSAPPASVPPPMSAAP